jgi:hypothetical protein
MVQTSGLAGVCISGTASTSAPHGESEVCSLISAFPVKLKKLKVEGPD